MCQSTQISTLSRLSLSSVTNSLQPVNHLSVLVSLICHSPPCHLSQSSHCLFSSVPSVSASSVSSLSLSSVCYLSSVSSVSTSSVSSVSPSSVSSKPLPCHTLVVMWPHPQHYPHTFPSLSLSAPPLTGSMQVGDPDWGEYWDLCLARTLERDWSRWHITDNSNLNTIKCEAKALKRKSYVRALYFVFASKPQANQEAV